jgi:endonuclease/exonuclease/phosphatase (EEP) superfamily protein YafD
MRWLGLLMAAIVASWTLLPLARHEAWWIRTFDFPRVQIAAATAVALGLYLWLFGVADIIDAVAVTVLAACVVYQLVLISAYTPLRTVQAKDAQAADPASCLSLMVANVLTPNRNADALLEIVARHDADLLLFVETDEWWQGRLDVLERSHPYTVKCPLSNTYGMHLYSRLELIEPELEFLVEEDVPSIHAWVALGSGRRVRIYCIHPSPPAPNTNVRSTERDAELLTVAKAVAEQAEPAIVLGDLNDVAWSATTRLFQRISGMLDPRIGRGMFATFHAKYAFLRWPLDHIFFTPQFRVASLKRLGYFGSDHFPIYATLCYSPGEDTAEEEPEHADAEDREIAEEKIEEVGAQGASERLKQHEP